MAENVFFVLLPLVFGCYLIYDWFINREDAKSTADKLLRLPFGLVGISLSIYYFIVTFL